MSQRQMIIGTTAGLIALMLLGTVLYLRPYFVGIRPAWIASPQTKEVVEQLPQIISEETGPFTIHEDFAFKTFSKDVVNPRVMIEDALGNVLVSEPEASRVSLVNPQGERQTVLSNLNRPHGLALSEGKLYVAETGQVLRYDYSLGKAQNPEVLLDLPAGGRHWTRTIAFGPDGALYLSIGSSCNICVEEDWRRDKILRYDLQTQELEEYATGLRNAVFFAWHPETGEMYATEMGRDWLGDDLPPDELNKIEEGKDYGFPYCYGKNIVDPEFSHTAACEQAEPSLFDFIAHEAPLGIDFLQGDAIVALHGSWNRTEPVGYEVIRLSEETNFQQRESIMSGFLQEDGSSVGRPAGILTLSDNSVLISDDKADVIYQLIPKN